VSHYLLARGLETVGLKERDIKVVNTSDADIVGAFNAKDSTAVVTWKPQLAEVTKMPNTTLAFDSSKIPGEILDLMVVNSATLKANPNLGKALVGAWYETLKVMFGTDAKAAAALAHMAKASGTDVPDFKSQLATTRMYATPAEAYAFATSPTVGKTMDLVRTFSFARPARRRREVQTRWHPAGRWQPSRRCEEAKMRFDASFTRLAVDGKL
jgi:NitT/TauT family transport system substrate-binding protein